MASAPPSMNASMMGCNISIGGTTTLVQRIFDGNRSLLTI
jgi:hypothetical protein